MDFYKIDEKYIVFLQDYERKKRGITKVPNIKYTNNNKFSFGSVLTINGYKYYVSLSSFTKSQEANILIKVPGDEVEIKGSLRFNYMVPVPDFCLTRFVIKNVADKKYRDLLNKEYTFCQNNIKRIEKKANKIYDMVTNNKKQQLTDNSCDFRLLEEAHNVYIAKENKTYT